MALDAEIEADTLREPQDVVADRPVVSTSGAEGASLLPLRARLHPEIGRILVAAVFHHEALDLDVTQAAVVRGEDPPAGGDLDHAALWTACREPQVEPVCAGVVKPGAGCIIEFGTNRHLSVHRAIDEHLAEGVDDRRVSSGVAAAFAAAMPLVLGEPLTPPWGRGEWDGKWIGAVDMGRVGEQILRDHARPDLLAMRLPRRLPYVGALEDRCVPHL